MNFSYESILPIAPLKIAALDGCRELAADGAVEFRNISCHIANRLIQSLHTGIQFGYLFTQRFQRICLCQHTGRFLNAVELIINSGKLS